MKTTSTAAGFEGQTDGQAWLTFSDSSLKGVAFYVKCDSISGYARGRIVISGFKNGNLMPYIGFWESEEEILEYTLIELPFSPQETYDSIRLFVQAITAIDEVGTQLGYSSIIVDDIKGLTFINQTSEVNKNEIKIYPNPIIDELIISVNKPNVPFRFVVYDKTGKLIYKGFSLTKFTSLKTENWDQGNYILKLYEMLNDTLLAKYSFVK